MKKHVLFLFTMIAIYSGLIKAQILIPQLQAGVYVNDTIDLVSYPFTAHCDSVNLNHCSFSLTSDLTPIVSGVELMYIVNSVPAYPDSAYTLETGILHVGDTLF